MLKVFLTLCLLGQAVPGFAQTPEEFIRKAQAAPDSNHRAAIYSEAIKKHPADPRLYHKRGVAYGIMDYHDKAFADFDKAVALDPSVPAYYQDRGLALHRLKRNDEAVGNFTKLIELEPGNARAYYLRAVSYTNLKQLDKAEPDLDTAVRLDPGLKDDSAVRQIRGLLRSKKPLISIGAKPELPAPAPENKPSAPAADTKPVERPAQAAPPSAVPPAAPELEGAARSLATRAKVRANLKKYSEAAALWTELLELQPGYYPAYAERAYALHKSGEKEKAAADFEKAFAADPAQPRAFLLRGAAACADADFGRAAADLEKALSLDPKIKRDILYSFTSVSVRSKKNCK